MCCPPASVYKSPLSLITGWVFPQYAQQGAVGPCCWLKLMNWLTPTFPPWVRESAASQHCNRDMSLSYAVLTLTWYASSLVYGMIKYLCVCVCVCGGGYVSMSVGEKKQVVKGPSLFPLPLLTPLSMRTLLPCVFLGWSCMCVAVVSWALPPCPDY